ncbi:carboxypeptidase-like regulatory domain-containing protein [Dysgonomonas capnocytophagoides]|uniref:Carboxypeptidase-like regulatory domain-containing protein n=1 Tax=Dysgonomonas capnocytophagoides TaxID=45254 RepID=A0A4Y8L0J1_9BACT|nr:carboxypeptidase-like regulatory domain-containing protein [Dysgonomonas capnocytophagoides]TFD96083.1 carboxypeptidase-like regulatory domain-containing protein [Dysgonomonas capnocytophagoides]
MKPSSCLFLNVLLAVFFLSSTFPLSAQDDSVITISGIVKDQKSKKKLEYVNISVQGTNIGTVSNSDGEFTLKIPVRYKSDNLLFTHLGYNNHLHPIGGKNIENETFMLTSDSQVLDEVVIRSGDPLAIVREAAKKIDLNYTNSPTILSGFYRETIQKGKRYIDISEAVMNIYKTSYSQNTDNDGVQIYKGRRLLSPKPSDTLSVKLQGGPNLAIYGDIVKQPYPLLDEESLPLYMFKMEDPVTINERPHYTIRFTPQAIAEIPLYTGNIYIDQQNLTISRVEYSLSMDNRDKVTRIILKKKPPKLRFKPNEVSFVVTYKTLEGRSRINYIRNQIRFNCDWKRRLFSTSYTVISELVVTDSKPLDMKKAPSKEFFKQNQTLSDKISNFSDQNFWEAYNIIEPTESLESAVVKLKKQYNE